MQASRLKAHEQHAQPRFKLRRHVEGKSSIRGERSASRQKHMDSAAERRI